MTLPHKRCMVQRVAEELRVDPSYPHPLENVSSDPGQFKLETEQERSSAVSKLLSAAF